MQLKLRARNKKTGKIIKFEILDIPCLEVARSHIDGKVLSGDWEIVAKAGNKYEKVIFK